MIITNRRLWRKYKVGYEVWKEDWQTFPEEEPTEIKAAYTPDGHYLGNPRDAHRLTKKFGIRKFEKVKSYHGVCSIGFNPEQQKWYGWSHRAIYGFGIGSTCKKGDCHYIPSNKQEFIDDCISFWSDENKMNIHWKEDEDDTFGDGSRIEKGIRVIWTYDDTVKNKDLHYQITSVFCPWPTNWGRGEWTAETLEDAKQMAIDFNDGVS